MDYPKSKDEWWQLVYENWDDLRSPIETFHPTKTPPELAITAPNAEKARQYVASKVKTLPDYKLLKEQKDPALLNVFNDTYFGIPESTSCWSYPGFGLLCDLCSEGYVLEE